MELGIFAKTFLRTDVGEVFSAVKQAGLSCVQFNLACAGLVSMPDQIPDEVVAQIAAESKKHAVRIAAVSGTFNMIHPDVAVRQKGLARLQVLAAACAGMGTNVITLCTGTRDPENMWRKHADNQKADAWDDLLVSMREAIYIAEKYNVILGVEPEVSNIIDSAAKARCLLDHFQSPHLKIIMDAANLFHSEQIVQMQTILEHAFKLLGKDIVIAHAKDLVEGQNVKFAAAGQGCLDYRYYLQLLHQHQFDGALILHGLPEAQVGHSVQFLRENMRQEG